MAKFPTGKSSTSATILGTSFTFYTYKPTSTPSGLMMVFHGTNRNADDYRDSAAVLAKKLNYLVVAPLFDESRFNTDEYQRGGISGNEKNRNAWTTRFVAPMITWARTKEEMPSLPCVCFGHSAGGQFLSRVAAYERLGTDLVNRWVPSNPSTWVRGSGIDQNDGVNVDVDVSYDYAPFGFDTTLDGFTRADGLKGYLALPLTVYLGGSDTVRDSNLSSGVEAEAQGRNRRERGEFVFGEAKANAAALGVPFGWKKVIAAGVGHTASGMLGAPEALDAFKFDSTLPPPPPPPPDPIVISDAMLIRFNNDTAPDDMAGFRAQWEPRLTKYTQQWEIEQDNASAQAATD